MRPSTLRALFCVLLGLVGLGFEAVAPRKPPEAWYWSHDIKPDQIANILTLPGAHLVRLASYGEGNTLRFAAVVHKELGPPRNWHLGLDTAGLQRKWQDPAAAPVGIDSYVENHQRRFALVTQAGPGLRTTGHLDLDESSVGKLLDGQHRIVDFTTYLTEGGRRYAVVVAESPSEPAWFVAGLDAPGLEAKMRSLGARPVRLRGYDEDGTRRYAAVLEKAGSGRWAWYPGLDADAVAKKLEDNQAYPVDLDPTRDSRGVRFNVVMYAQ
jgi:hypothetical protein